MIGEGLVSLVGVPLLLRRKTRIRPEAIYVRSTKLELVLMMQTIRISSCCGCGSSCGSSRSQREMNLKNPRLVS